MLFSKRKNCSSTLLYNQYCKNTHSEIVFHLNDNTQITGKIIGFSYGKENKITQWTIKETPKANSDIFEDNVYILHKDIQKVRFINEEVEINCSSL